METIDQEELINYLSLANNAAIINCSSFRSTCLVSNLLTKKPRELWLSSEGLPQEFTIDISNLSNSPNQFACFG